MTWTGPDIAAGVLAGDVRALARAATLVEDATPEGDRLLRQLAPHAGRALVIGVTGPPGAGKSTLAARLAAHYRALGKTVGIAAVDPSSPVSGGAILGDRIRMQSHSGDDGVFIRSMATRGALGGLARATAGLVLLLDAAGRDVILIETVGVGQAETEIARLAAVICVVLAPGMGDDVQAMKAGVLEIARIFVINKADHEGVDRLEVELRADFDKPIIRTVATEGTGIDELVSAIAEAPAGPMLRAIPHAGGAVIDHLGVAVRSLAESAPFWTEWLGLAASGTQLVPAEKVQVAMLTAGEARIELLEASEPGSVIATFLEKRGPGLHHVALRMRDFDATLERLRSAGVRLLGEPRAGADGHTYVFVHPSSTGGVLIELIREEHSS